jgi:hypothetical protein
VFARIEVRRLRELIADLTRDQQLVLASQVLVDMEPAEFCARYGWSVEKYRKVAQRGRSKLRVLAAEYERGERCRRLEPDLLALSAGVAQGVALSRARTHLSNCPPCARMVGELERTAGSLGALLPLPATAGAGGLAARLSGVWSAVRRAVGIVRHPLAEVGTSGGAGVAGGSLASAGALKVGVVALCVAGAAGSYAACSRLGVLPALGLGQVQHRAAPRRPRASHRPRAHTHAVRVVRASPPASRAPAPARGSTAARVPQTSALAPAAAVHPPRLSAIAQIRREFGTTASVASIGVGTSLGSGSTSASVIAQVRREFAGAAGRVASAGASVASGSGSASASVIAQVRREFGGPRAHVASGVGRGASGARSASASAIAQVHREFGRPRARAASTLAAAPAVEPAATSGTLPAPAAAPPGASGAADAPSSTVTATTSASSTSSGGSGEPTTVAPSPTPPPNSAPSAAAGQAQAEFGFEK